MVGLMATSSKMAYATCCMSQVCYSQSPYPHGRPLLTRAFTGDTQKQVWLSLCGVSGSWWVQVLFEPSKCLWWVWSLILNMISPLLPSYWGLSFALLHWVFFLVGCNILRSTVIQQWVTILEFSQKLSAHPSTLPSCAALKFNIQKTKIMASGPITSWQVDRETMETVADYFLGLQNHCRWWLQPWN